MYLIKDINSSFLEPLSMAMNKSPSTGIAPNFIKVAKVVPVFKERGLTNYRPIAILPSMSKVLQKVIHKHLFPYLTSKKKTDI